MVCCDFFTVALFLIWIHPTSGLFLPIDAISSSTSMWPGLPRNNDIQCFDASRGGIQTTVDGCRPTLNHLRTFSGYSRVQAFQYHKAPKITIPMEDGSEQILEPPFNFHTLGSNCILQITTINSREVDTFSFLQARATATNILQHCADLGEPYGGTADLGRGRGWKVQVLGYDLPPRNRTVLLEGNERGNGTFTSATGWIINTSSA